MKTLLATAATAVAVLSATAAAQTFPAVPGAPAHSAAHRPGIMEDCKLIYGGYYVIALAVPHGASSWSLDLRSPGMSASQGGPLDGVSSDMTTLSQVVLLQDPTGRGVQSLRSRPVHAELLVHDDRGRTICRDTVRTQGPWR
ncbi:MAG: hypothetical protein NXI12_13730 [Alphaproteobacteria bacterium]|nr:hypothetical protein [Alphaproteobacteria bacterium]